MLDFLKGAIIQNIGYCADLLWLAFQGETDCTLHVQTNWTFTQNDAVLLNQDALDTAVQADIQGNVNPYGQFLQAIQIILSSGLQGKKITDVQIVRKNILLFFEDGYAFQTVFCPANGTGDELWRVIDETRQRHYMMSRTESDIAF